MEGGPRRVPQDSLPAWAPLGRMSFVLSGVAQTFFCEAPPSKILSHAAPTSICLREAVAYTTWLEAARAKVTACIAAAGLRPCVFHCPGILTAIGPAKQWLLDAGFVATPSGLRTPYSA